MTAFLEWVGAWWLLVGWLHITDHGGHEFHRYFGWLLLMLTTPVMLYTAKPYFVHGYKAIRNGAANMDVLVALGSGVSFIYSVLVLLGVFSGHVYFETAAMIVALISIGKYIEALAKGRTSAAIKSLMALRPKTARKVIGIGDYGLGINDNPQSIMTNIQANVFDDLRVRREAGELYDVVVLDPPKFAHNPSQIERAARAYKDLNRVGMHLVKPGGVLATFSCSGVVDASLFQKIIFSAAMEAEREVHIVEHLSQASDHPVLLTFPESEYLKGLICRVY